MKKSLTFFLLAFTPVIFADNFTTQVCDNVDSQPFCAAYPGGIAVIPLTIQTRSAPKAYYDNHRVMVLKNDDPQSPWVAVVGIPLEAKTGTQFLTVKNNKINFTVRNKIYPLRHITIKDTSKVTPDPKLAKLIETQLEEAKEILNTWNANDTIAANFILPAKGYFSSGFGIRRIYNNVKPGRHTGLDIAAMSGTSIVAPAAGTVIAVKDFVLTGNTVYIDHGQGLISSYCHMSRVDVKPGETVTQGEEIGAVGATGRVTGAHLHWSVSLNGTMVDPKLLIANTNNNN